MGNVNTYDSTTEAEADRAQQRELLAALGAWDRALRRNECGAWTIIGSRGSIHTFGDGQTWWCSLPAGRPYIGPIPSAGLPSARSGKTARMRAPCGCTDCQRKQRPPSSDTCWASARGWNLPPTSWSAVEPR